MSGLFSNTGIGKNPQSTLLTGGGAGAPWNFGVSPFDQSTIDAATNQNEASIQARYNQLGLGGSTMAQQDKAGAAQAGTAMTGELQTANEADPALNPALQPQLNSLIGQLGSTGGGGTLSSLASAAGLGSSLGNLFGGSAAAGGTSTLIDDALAGLTFGA